MTIVKLHRGGGFACSTASAGRGIEVRPREAAIARAMLERPALTLHHHARILADMVPEAAADHVAIIATLERFQGAGLLDRVAVIDEETTVMPKN